MKFKQILKERVKRSYIAEVYPNFEYAQTHGIHDILAEVKELVAAHNEELPTYARIADVTVRKHPFPKTASKKIMRDKFFAEKADRKKQQAALRKPETELQQQIYDLCSKVLEARPEIKEASCYMVYYPSVRDMSLKAEVTPADGVSKDAVDTAKISEEILAQAGEMLSPKFIDVIES